MDGSRMCAIFYAQKSLSGELGGVRFTTATLSNTKDGINNEDQS